MPPGIKTDDTASAAAPGWSDGSNVRFRLGRAQVIGGWERVTLSTIPGICRTVFAWTDNNAQQHLGLGQHNKLHVWKSGTLADITPTSGFTAGAIDGAGSAGYGTGTYGVGDYGEDSASDYFPLTWSLAAWGQKLLGSPRNQTLFEWSNNTASPAVAIANAPDNITHMLVSPQFQVFALGCNEETSGDFNPMCIRHSAARDNTAWTTSLASNGTHREYILPGGGRIVAGRVIGKYLLVWTNWGLFLGTYVGQVTKIWEFSRISDRCGLIGPNAAAVLNGVAYWISPDRQFWRYMLGGRPEPIPCPIREDFAENLAASQGDKIVASTVAEFSEVRWDYPDARDGYENSRYVAVAVEGPDAGSWYKGAEARTAMVDAGPTSYPCGVTYGGAIYWHEKGNSADGGQLSWFIESADIYLDEDRHFLVRGAWPDIAQQMGAVQLTLTTRAYPQGEGTTYGPYAMPPGEDRVDFLAEGLLFRVKFSGSSAPTSARLGRLLFDAKPRGRK